MSGIAPLIFNNAQSSSINTRELGTGFGLYPQGLAKKSSQSFDLTFKQNYICSTIEKFDI